MSKDITLFHFCVAKQVKSFTCVRDLNAAAMFQKSFLPDFFETDEAGESPDECQTWLREQFDF